jgi:hypothetical protein
MQGRDRWKLADELNVYQLALLIAGHDPADFAATDYEWNEEARRDAAPYLSAIKNAALAGRFKHRQILNRDETGIDWVASTIDIESFVAWLKIRNFRDGFFVPTVSEASGIANANGPYYAVKLAAAVRAWTEVTSNPAMLSGKSPKKALEIWLRKHAAEYGLTGKDGNPNKLGIEEISKVANWRPAGGASPTPSLASPSSPVVATGGKVPAKAAHPKGSKEGFDKVLNDDEEIPF